MLVITQSRTQAIVLNNGTDTIEIECYKDANGKVVKIKAPDSWDISRKKLTEDELEEREFFIADQKARKKLKLKEKRRNRNKELIRNINGNI